MLPKMLLPQQPQLYLRNNVLHDTPTNNLFFPPSVHSDLFNPIATKIQFNEQYLKKTLNDMVVGSFSIPSVSYTHLTLPTIYSV